VSGVRENHAQHRLTLHETHIIFGMRLHKRNVSFSEVANPKVGAQLARPL